LTEKKALLSTIKQTTSNTSVKADNSAKDINYGA